MFRKIAVSIGKARIAYIYWTIAQLLTAAAVLGLTKWLGVESLKFIVLINITLLSIPSWLIVSGYDKALRLPFESTLVRTAITLLAIFPIALLLGQLYPTVDLFVSSRVAGLGFLAMAIGVSFAAFLIVAWVLNVPGVRDIAFRLKQRIKQRLGQSTNA